MCYGRRMRYKRCYERLAALERASRTAITRRGTRTKNDLARMLDGLKLGVHDSARILEGRCPSQGHRIPSTAKYTRPVRNSGMAYLPSRTDANRVTAVSGLVALKHENITSVSRLFLGSHSTSLPVSVPMTSVH